MDKNQPWQESAVLDYIKKQFGKYQRHAAVIPNGDDAYAFIPVSQSPMLITTDSMIENVHWRNKWCTPEDLAAKLVAVNVSDLAAMGGIPERAFLNIAVPKKSSRSIVEAFIKALIKELDHYQVDLCGGDTTASGNAMMLSLTLTGRAVNKRMLTRAGAEPGDLILVTGDLGGAVAGRTALGKPKFNAAWREAIVERFNKPVPRLEEGQWLAQSKKVKAMMDISDGLASDIKKLAGTSKTGAVIYAANIPVAMSTRMAASRFKQDVLSWALTGGEDYELLLTCSSDQAGSIMESLHEQFNTPSAIVGEITARSKGFSLLTLQGNRIPLPDGYEHKG